MAISLNNRDCSGVLEKERELLEVQENGGRSMSSCFTGIKLSKDRKSTLKAYFALVDEIVDMGVPIKQVYRNLPKSALSSPGGSRGLVNITSLKLHSPIRKRMIDYIFKQCANDKPVDLKELVEISGVNVHEWGEEDYREHYQTNRVSRAISARGVRLNTNQHLWELVSKTVNEGDTSTLRQNNKSLLGKLRLLRALSEPLFNHCEKMNTSGFGDNPYAALAHLVKFWNEGHPVKEEA